MTLEETIVEPTDKQIHRASLFGWEYVGDGIFIKEGQMGYFTEKGWEVSLD